MSHSENVTDRSNTAQRTDNDKLQNDSKKDDQPDNTFDKDDFMFISCGKVPDIYENQLPQLGKVEILGYSACAIFYGGGWIITNAHVIDLDFLDNATIKFPEIKIEGRGWTTAFRVCIPTLGRLTHVPDLCWVHFPALENFSNPGLATLETQKCETDSKLYAHHFGYQEVGIFEPEVVTTSGTTVGNIIQYVPFSSSSIRLIMHTAPTYPGASGGPLLLNSKLFGIHVGGKIGNPSINYALEYDGVKKFVGSVISIIAELKTLDRSTEWYSIRGLPPPSVVEIKNSVTEKLRSICRAEKCGIELCQKNINWRIKIINNNNTSSDLLKLSDAALYKKISQKLWQQYSSRFNLDRVEGYFGGPQHRDRVQENVKRYLNQLSPIETNGISSTSVSEKYAKSVIRRYLREKTPDQVTPRKEIERKTYSFPDITLQMDFRPGDNNYYLYGSTTTFDSDIRKLFQDGLVLELEYLQTRFDNSGDTQNINEASFIEYLRESYERSIQYFKELVMLLTKYQATFFAGIHKSQSDSKEHITLEVHNRNPIHIHVGKGYFTQINFWENISSLQC